MPIGAGLAPAGSAAAGYGVPDSAHVPNNAVLPLPINGLPQTGRAINPQTKSYTFTADGRIVGAPTVQQLVQLALITVRGSSCVATLGNTVSQIQEKGTSYAQLVTSAITDALADLIKDKQVQIASITVQDYPNKPDAATATLKWIDLSTGIQSITNVGP